MAHDLFVSYAHEDRETAEALTAALESSGFRCWIAPRDIVAGEEWAAAIVHAIAGSRMMVLVFSQHSNASPQIRREVERAVHNNVIILPFRIEELPLNPSLELFLGAAHWLDVADMPRDRAIEALVGSVTKLVKGVDPTPVPPPAPPAPPPRPPDGKDFKAVYIAAIVFSVALTVVVYVFAFDRFGETEMVYLSPIWCLGFVFGGYGLLLSPNSLKPAVVAAVVGAVLLWIFMAGIFPAL